MKNKSRFIVTLIALLGVSTVGWWALSSRPGTVTSRDGEKASPPVQAAIAAERATPPEGSSPELTPARRAGRSDSAARQDLAWQEAVPEPAFAAFGDWTRRYASADATGKSALAVEGVRLAEARRAEFAKTMRENPARALELAVPVTVRRALPPEVLAQLELPVDARGDIEHYAALPVPGAADVPPPNRHEVVIGGAQRLKAYVTAERAGQPSRYRVPVHGYQLDEEIVVRPTAGRLLEPVEVAEARAAQGGEAICPVSQEDTTINADEAGLAIGGEAELFCAPAHAALELEERTAAEQDAPPQNEPTASDGGTATEEDEVVAASSHTEGVKTLIIIRIDFSDHTNAPISEATGNNALNLMSNAWNGWSYGRCTLNVANSEVTTQVLRMPWMAATYDGDAGTLYNHALAAATSAGYNLNNYSFRMVAMDGGTPGFGWAGLGTVGGNKSWVRAEGEWYFASVAIHELGHNLGLNHAQSYTIAGANPIASGGSTAEYGDIYDAVGGGDVPDSYNARYKLYLNWLTAADYPRVTKSGTYRLAAQDKSTATGIRALRVARTTSQDYNVEYRSEQDATNDNGVQVRWSPNGTGNGKTQLLDMTSGSGSGLNDAALAVGKTFADTPGGVYLTTLAKVPGASADSMDVLVNMGANVLPAPWVAGDIGTPGTAGLSSFANGTFVVNGAGQDIYFAADGFQYARQPITGDCDIRARVPVQTNTDGSARAGIMLRDGSDAGSKHASIYVTAGFGFRFQYRSATGGSTSNVTGPALNAAPDNWLRLTRAGNLITSYVSADGVTWTLVGSTTIAMASTVNGGFAVCGRADPALGAATFDNVAVEALPSPWQMTDIGAGDGSWSAVHAAGVFTMNGSGWDIFGAADEFQFVNQTVSGDFDLRARVTSQSNTNPSAKAGVMIRDGTAPGAKHATTMVIPGGTSHFQYRSASFGPSGNVTGPALNAAPDNWVRVVRYGDTLFSFVSADGTAWTPVGSATIAMSATVNAGLASTSHADGMLNSATFDNVSIAAITTTAPVFTSSSLTEPPAASGIAYSGSTLAGEATDPDGDPLTFSKVSGPAWLSIAADGTLSGTPAVLDAGANVFTVRVTDPFGLYDEVTMNIAVTGPVEMVKENNSNTLNLGGSWAGGAAPGASNVAVWNSIVTGANTVGLGANTTWTGLRVDDPGGDVTINGGFTLATGAVNTGTARSLTFANTNTSTLTALAGSTTLTVSRAGSNNWTATLNAAGALRFNGTLALRGGTASASTAAMSGHWLAFGGASLTQEAATAFALDTGAASNNAGDFIMTDAWNGKTLQLTSLTGHGAIRSDWSTNGTRTLLVNQAADTTFNGMFLGSNGRNVVLQKADAGTLTMAGLIGAQAGTPRVDLTVEAGTLVLAANNARVNASDATTIAAGATLKVGAGGTTGTLGTSNAVTNHGTLVFHRSDAFSVANAIGGSGGVTQQGTGITTLSGASSYTGATSVQAGTLLVNGALTGTSGVTVAATGELSGSGSIANEVAVSGTLAPGSGVGTLTTGPLSFVTGSRLAWQAANWTGAAGTGYDHILTPSLDLSATATITVALSEQALVNFTNADATFTLVQTTGGITGFDPDKFVIDRSAFPSAPGGWAVQQDGDNLLLAYTASPPIQPTPWKSWRQTHFGTDVGNESIAGDAADPDFDGIPNLLEYGLATDPMASNPSGITHEVVTIGPDRFLRLTITKNEAATDLQFTVEVTGNLANPAGWNSAETVIEENTSTRLIVRDTLTTGPRFIRLKVTLLP